MNITAFNIGTHISNQGKNGSIFAGNLPMLQHAASKSTQDKLERQQNTQEQVAFWEKQKENLKNIECGSVEEIAKKLEMFHTYEDEIAVAKMKYNSEQMWHIMDEAEELGEKIAKAAEKLEPKTAEERREEMVEEALGIDDVKGELAESMEEIQKEMEELQEEMQEEMQEETLEETNREIEDLVKQSLEDQDLAEYKGIDIRI